MTDDCKFAIKPSQTKAINIIWFSVISRTLFMCAVSLTPLQSAYSGAPAHRSNWTQWLKPVGIPFNKSNMYSISEWKRERKREWGSKRRLELFYILCSYFLNLALRSDFRVILWKLAWSRFSNSAIYPTGF